MFSYSRYVKLQKHHGISKLRIAKLFFLKFLAVLIKQTGLASCFNKALTKKKIDVLFVFNNVSSASRLSYIKGMLEDKGLSAASIQLDNFALQIYSILLGAKKEIPAILLGGYCNVNFLITKYDPKVAVISVNSDVFPGLFRFELNKLGRKLINIAHGTGYSGIAHTSSDFDYWFVFGQSTINGKLLNKKRVGATKAVIVGSPFIFGDMENVKIEKKSVKTSVLIASQWVPQRLGMVDAFSKSREILIKLIEERTEYQFFVKRHHIETNDFWVLQAKKHDNLKILDRDVTLVDALNFAHICLHMSSNAAIEAGLMRIPSIAIDPGGYSSHLQIKQFLPVVETSDGLQKAFCKMLTNYEEYQQYAHDYALHMYGGYSCGAGLRIRDHIHTIVCNGVLKGTQLVPDTSFLDDTVS